MPRPSLRTLLLAAAWATAALSLLGAVERDAPLLVNVGVGDGPFARGFRGGWERDGLGGSGETTFRWALDGSRLELPLRVLSPSLRVRMRLARFLADPAEIVLLANGREVDRWRQPPRGWQVRELSLGPWDGPLSLSFRTDAGGEGMAVAVDWVEVRGAERVVPPPGLLARLGLLLAGVPLVVALAAGSTAGMALGALATALVTLAVTADRFGALVGASEAGWPALAAVAVLCLLTRLLATRWPELLAERTAIFLPAFGVVVALVGLLHPFYFYPDVDTHLRLFQALRADPLLILDATRPWARRGDWTREIGGVSVAIPYSVVFHGLAWPLAALLGVAPALKTVAVLAVGLTTLLTWALARGLGLAPLAAAMAQILLLTLPVTTSRLSLALYPTLLGQALVLLLTVHLVRALMRLDSLRAGRVTFLVLLAAHAAYTGSLVVLGAFLPAVLLLEAAAGNGRRAWRLLLLWSAAALLVVLVMYGRFFWVFWRDVLPYLGAASSGPRAAAPDLGSLLVQAAQRGGLFFGALHPALAVLGLLCLRGAPPPTRRLLGASLLAGLALLALRYRLPVLFRDAKDVELLAPPVAVAATATLATAWSTGRRGRFLATAAFVLALSWSLKQSAAWYLAGFVAAGRGGAT